MPDLNLIRTVSGFVPEGVDPLPWLEKIKAGETVPATIKLKRNSGFHRKFFAMLKVAYDNYEWPEIETQWGKARCSYDMFRKYVIVKAGHYTVDLTPKGEVRAEPKSISFAKMDQAEFEQLYSDVLDVILAEFLGPIGWDADQMENAVNRMMNFA